MLLSVTGASGVGKSTALAALTHAFANSKLVCVEFDSVGVPEEIVHSTGADGTTWRHRTIEHWVQRAVAEQRAGRHLVLCGQVPVGELLAVPSAELLDGIAACLLHCSPEVRRQRLIGRGENPEELEAQLSFGEWIYNHMTDPTYMPEVIRVDGAMPMHWERWTHWKAGDPRWSFEVIDTDALTPEQVAERVVAWVRGTLSAHLAARTRSARASSSRPRGSSSAGPSSSRSWPSL